MAVSTRREGDSIRIYISDDGIGFDVSVKKRHKAKKKSFGLFSVKERLDFLGGKLEIKSEPGQGTRVTLEAPLNVI